MLAAGQFVFRRRLVFAHENAVLISPCKEGFSLSVGADFAGKSRTLRLCTTNSEYIGEDFTRLVAFFWIGLLICQ